MHKINPDINVMCELHITGKLYTAACSLSDADSGFEKEIRHTKKEENLFRLANDVNDSL